MATFSKKSDSPSPVGSQLQKLVFPRTPALSCLPLLPLWSLHLAGGGDAVDVSFGTEHSWLILSTVPGKYLFADCSREQRRSMHTNINIQWEFNSMAF